MLDRKAVLHHTSCAACDRSNNRFLFALFRLCPVERSWVDIEDRRCG